MSEDTLAWPQSLLGEADAADATFALHHSAEAALAVTDGAVTGDDGAVELEYDSAGLSDAEKAAFPALASYVALHPVGLSRSDVAGLVTEQLLVSQETDDTLSALTGVQLPGVLDDLYAADLSLEHSRRELVGSDRRPCGCGRRRRRAPRCWSTRPASPATRCRCPPSGTTPMEPGP